MKLERGILSSINQSSWFWRFGSFEALTGVRVEFGIIIIVPHRIILVGLTRHFFQRIFLRDLPRKYSETKLITKLLWLSLTWLNGWENLENSWNQLDFKNENHWAVDRMLLCYCYYPNWLSWLCSCWTEMLKITIAQELIKYSRNLLCVIVHVQYKL